MRGSFKTRRVTGQRVTDVTPRVLPPLASRACRRGQLSSIFNTAVPSKRFASKNAANALPTPAVLPKPRLDYRAITDSIVYKSHNAFNRKFPLPVGALQSIARSYLDFKRHTQSLFGNRIRTIKDPTEKQPVLVEAKALKAEILLLEEKLAAIEEDLLGLALHLPNDTHPEVPIGPEDAATILSTRGPPVTPASAERDHVAIGRALGLFDFEAGAVVTGSSWYYLLKEAALLETALTNYAISVALKYGFQFVMTPDVVRGDVAIRCGFQPRDQNTGNAASQTYQISDTSPELVLSATAEIPLAGLFANKIFPENTLPAKVVGLGRSFRAEAGSRGADTRGLYRVHQFTKVELFIVSEEDSSAQHLEEIRKIQTEIFESLNFPFRVLDMPTEELGASAYRKYDMEAWMPGRGSWGEISSASNCTDYQARRLHIRYRRSTSSRTPLSTSDNTPAQAAVPFAHTLNGTAAAIPRLIVALLENGARFDEKGKVLGLNLPVALRPFWIGTSEIVSWV